MGSGHISIQCDSLVRTTELAYLFRFGEDEIWIPKSVVEGLHPNNEIMLKEWFVMKEELESYII